MLCHFNRVNGREERRVADKLGLVLSETCPRRGRLRSDSYETVAWKPRGHVFTLPSPVTDELELVTHHFTLFC